MATPKLFKRPGLNQLQRWTRFCFFLSFWFRTQRLNWIPNEVHYVQHSALNKQFPQSNTTNQIKFCLFVIFKFIVYSIITRFVCAVCDVYGLSRGICDERWIRGIEYVYMCEIRKSNDCINVSRFRNSRLFPPFIHTVTCIT